MFSLLQKKGVTKKEIHKFIKKTGKDILSTKDESGQTIVHICASEGKIDILDFLLNKYKNNLNLDMKDNLGWTPLVCAAHNAQLSAIELLLKHNADPNIKTNDEAICLHYFAKIKVNSKDVGYYTSVAKQLVKKISNLDVQNKIGETPLHKAARDGVVEFVKILIEHGANPNLQDINGYTPLHVAASVGEVDVVSALLNGKTDTTLRSNDGTAREIAQAKNFVKIVQMIDDFEKTHNLRSSTATLPKSTDSQSNSLKMSLMSPKISSFTPPASPSSIHDKKPPPLERLNQASISSFSRINVTNDPKNDSPNLALITKPSQRFVSRFDSDLDSLQKYIRGEHIIEQEFQELEKRLNSREFWKDREERLKKDQIRRYNIMREIVESEKAYVALISTAVKNVRDPLRSGSDPILTQMDEREIFTVLPNILIFNQKILEDLETRFKSWNPNQIQSQIVGDIFKNMSRYMKTYTEYITKFDPAVRIAKRLMKKNKRFSEWLEEAKRKHGIDLFRLLIAPIQRIPFYVFLIEDLLKYTPQDHPDHKELSDTLNTAREVARHLETMRTDSENRSRVLKIKHNLVGYNEELATPDRLFIKDGFAQLLVKGKAVPHHLFLFNDLLLWAKVSKGKSGDTYSYVGSTPVSDITSCLSIESEIGKYSFSVWTKHKQLIFLAENEDDRRSWIRAIVDLAVKINDHIWKKIETKGTTPSKRSSHSCVVVDQKLYLFGGQRNSNWFNDMYILDLDTLEWTKVPDSENAPTPRSEHAATVVDDKIWIFGGFDGTNRLNDLYSFDTKTQKWTKVNIAKEPPMGRSGHKMVRYGSSTIYIFGGIDNQGNYSNELFSFDVNRNPVEMKWIKTTGEVPDVRAFHSMDVINGLIWIYGGYAFKKYYNDTKVLDTKHLKWAGILSDSEIPAPRYNHATVPLDSNILLLYGGFSGGDVNNDLWALDTDTKLWIQMNVPMQLEPRFRHTANIYTAISKHKEVIVIGGESFDGYCDSVLIFKGLGSLKEDPKYQAEVERRVRQRKERGVSVAPLLQDHPAVISEIGTPYNVQRKTHIDENFQWVGIDPVKDFEIKGILGEGAFGIVFEAEFKEFHTLVAIKEIKDLKSERMRREIENLRKLRHQNIVPFFGTLEKEKNLWILMECQLGSLKLLMRDCGKPLNEQQIAIVAKCTLAGLHHLHSNNIIHRDIKSANILFNDQAEIKLADFGIARQLSEELPSLKGTAGSYQWMAPEILNKEQYTVKADIWSFGMTILELLEGHVPKYNPLAHTLTSQPPPWIASSSPILTASTINSSMVATITKEAKPVHQYIENLKASPQLIEFVSLCLHVKPDLRPSALELLRHPFVQSIANVNQYDAFKDLIQIFLKNKKRRDQEFRNLSLKSSKKPTPTTKSRDLLDTHSTLATELDSIKLTILQQMTLSKNETVQELQKQLAISRAETEIARMELKQTREELEKQKVKLQELELNQKKKIQSEIDKFKKELLDEILGNIKTYIQVLAKENESGQVQISSNEKQQQMLQLVSENSKLTIELKALKEKNKVLSEEIELLKERLTNKSRPGTDEEDDDIVSHGRSLSKKSIGSEGSNNSDSGVTASPLATSPSSSATPPTVSSPKQESSTSHTISSSEAFKQRLTTFEQTKSMFSSITERSVRQLKKSSSIGTQIESPKSDTTQ